MVAGRVVVSSGRYPCACGRSFVFWYDPAPRIPPRRVWARCPTCGDPKHATAAWRAEQATARGAALVGIRDAGPTHVSPGILCMCIAYNLTRLLYLSVREGVEIQFGDGARVLAGKAWPSLQELHDTMTVVRSTTRRLGRIPPDEAPVQPATPPADDAGEAAA